MPEREPGRKLPAKGVHIYGGEPTIVWMTVCTKAQSAWMAQSIVRDTLHEVWQHDAQAWLVGDYVIMPDHVHLFCAPHDLRFAIERWVAFWKSQFSKRHPSQHWEWQRGSFHHRIRNQEDYHEKWIYMTRNPVEKQLVRDFEEWPFRGHVHDIRM
jgi:putative transposase